MTKWPAESKVDWEPVLGPSIVISRRCSNPNCREYATERHHVFSRGQIGKGTDWIKHIPSGKWYPNIIGLCGNCHRGITENKDWIRFVDGHYYWNGRDRIAGTQTDERNREQQEEKPYPGAICPTCERRIPHPKKPSSPATKVATYRIPIDDVETHKEILGEAAKVLGMNEKPHWIWATVTTMAAIVLQMTPQELNDIFQRRQK